MTHRFFRILPSLTGVWLAALVALSVASTAVASMDAPQNTPTPLALKASATPHPGFGTTGRVTVADDVNVADMITTEDGSLLVAGTLNDEIYVAKFLPDGSLDNSFGVNGKAIIDTYKPYEINAMARLSTGEIWVAGAYNVNTATPTGIVHQLTAQGAPHPNNPSLSIASVEMFTDLVVASSDTEIYLSGYKDTDMIVAKLFLQEFDGNWYFDFFGFGNEGVVTSNLVSGEFEARGVALQSDGKILVAAHEVNSPGMGSFLLARYLTDGSLDTSFGASPGWTQSLFGTNPQILDLDVIEDKALLTGYADFDGTGDTRGMLLKYGTDGGSDTTFGPIKSGGLTFLVIGRSTEFLDTTVMPNGDLIVAGSQDSQSLVLRFSGNGIFDGEFGVKDIDMPEFFSPEFNGNAWIPKASVVDGFGHYYAAGSIDLGAPNSELGLLGLGQETELVISTGPTRPAGLAPASLLDASVPADPFVSPTSDPISYTATMANGDPLPGWLSFDVGAGTFSGTPEIKDTGVYPIKLTASDGTISRAAYIDLGIQGDFMQALFNGAPRGWNYGAGEGTPVTLTYSFRQSTPTDDPSYATTWQALSTAEASFIGQILALISDQTGITFQPVEETNNTPIGNLRFGLADTGETWKVKADKPDLFDEASSIWFQRSLLRDSNGDPVDQSVGTAGFYEVAYWTFYGILKALGLNEPGQSAGKPAGLPAVEDFGLTDSHRFSLLSTTKIPDHQFGVENFTVYPSNLMLWDFASIQYLYGRNTQRDASALGVMQAFGGDVPALFAMTDNGGIDTIDLGGFSFFNIATVSNNSLINLNPGAFSSIRIAERPTSQSQFWGNENLVIAYDAIIENAYGGIGNDALIGNEANNKLRGRGGDDLIIGGPGADTIQTNTGRDRVVFQLGDSPYGIDSFDLVREWNRDDEIQLISAWAYDNRAETDDSYNLVLTGTALSAMAPMDGLTFGEDGYVNSGQSTVADFVAAAAKSSTLGEVAVWSNGTDGYVFISSGDASDTPSDLDLFIQIEGLKPDVAKLVIGEGDQAGRLVFVSTLPDVIFQDRFQ